MSIEPKSGAARAAHLRYVTPDAEAYAALLTPAECSEVTTLSVKTLANWRSAPGRYTGPPYIRIGQGRGRIRYPLAAVNEWIDAQRRPTRSRKKAA